MELALPSSSQRLAWNAEDPLASVHNYLIEMRVLVPLAFGIKMCFNCPHCNFDDADLDTTTAQQCSNCFGCNQRLMGGYAGLATALAIAVEYTKDGSPHGHGLVALCNLYSTNSLLDIAKMLKANSAAHSAEFVSRMKNFVDHLQRSKHFDQKQHSAREEMLETAFQFGQDESVNLIFHHLCIIIIIFFILCITRTTF